jgi:hypothetical protein
VYIAMSQNRRDLLKSIGTIGIAGIGGAVLSSGTAAAKPSVDWEAAYAGNYDNANRSGSMIDWIIIHTVQGSASSAVNWFQNPNANVSAHYTVSESGYQYQSVSDEDIAWHAGGSNYNTWSIGIEHGGYVSGTYEDAQYRASAALTRWLCEQYNIPKQHIGNVPYDAANPASGGVIGHEQVPSNGHTDPGPNWDWGYYMDLVRGGGGGGGFTDGDRVTPTTALNTRHRPGTESEILATMSAGTEGEIMNGPVNEDGYTWWGVHWLADDIWGWSVERYLNEV